MISIILEWRARAVKRQAAKMVLNAFDGVDWQKQCFTINGGTLLHDGSGETHFYRADEIDRAIARLNEVLMELQA
jgi:hypothetical protein